MMASHTGGSLGSLGGAAASQILPEVDIVGGVQGWQRRRGAGGMSVVFYRKWCCFLTYAFMCIHMHVCAFICISLYFACTQTRCILQIGCIRTHFATTLSCCILPMRDGCILMHFHTCCILDMLHFDAFSCIQKVRFMLMHSPRDAYVA